MDARKNILIVGAGAGGMVMGYHFSLAGANVTFYDRPYRIDEITHKPRRLYCYDDHQLKLFDRYETARSMDDVAASRFDIVITAVDGKAMHSEEGTKMLQDLGRAVRESDPILVCLGVAEGIVDFLAEHTGIPRERSLFGSFAFLSHNIPLPGQKMPEEIDQEALASSEFAYRHFIGKGKSGLAITRLNAKLGKKFAEVYGQSGVSACSIAPNLRIMDFMSCFPFPALVAFVIEEWPEPEKMYATSTWKLASKATLEIASLPQYGFLGKLLAVIGGPINLLTRLWASMSKDVWPLDYHAFNQFHHGGKVLAQDVEIVRDILAREEQSGRKMPNLRALIERLDEKESL